MIVIVIVWATQPATPGKQIEIPSKQMLSLTFLMSKDIEKMKSVILLIDIALRKWDQLLLNFTPYFINWISLFIYLDGYGLEIKDFW